MRKPGLWQETMPDTESLPAGRKQRGTETAPQARTEPDTQTSDVPDTQAGAEPDRNAKAAVTEESDAVSAGTTLGAWRPGDTGDAQMDPASGNRTPASESVEESLQAARDAAAKELEAYIRRFPAGRYGTETAPGRIRRAGGRPGWEVPAGISRNTCMDGMEISLRSTGSN